MPAVEKPMPQPLWILSILIWLPKIKPAVLVSYPIKSLCSSWLAIFAKVLKKNELSFDPKLNKFLLEKILATSSMVKSLVMLFNS